MGPGRLSAFGRGCPFARDDREHMAVLATGRDLVGDPLDSPQPDIGEQRIERLGGEEVDVLVPMLLARKPLGRRLDQPNHILVRHLHGREPRWE